MLKSGAKDASVTVVSLETVPFMKRWLITVSIYLLPRPLPKLNIQSWEPLKNDVVPFVFVADNAFPLTTGIMKPYPDKGLTDKKRFLDTVLSRYRRVTESTFGIMASAFRVFYSKINLNPDKATKVVLAAVVLPNMLHTGHANTYTLPGFMDEIDGDNVVEGNWRKEANASIFQPLPQWKFGNKMNSQKDQRILC